jgi:hypothetical protein
MVIKNILSKDICYFLTHRLLQKIKLPVEEAMDAGAYLDRKMGLGLSSQYGDIFDTAHEMCWPIVEKFSGETLIPTYSYARLYKNGNILKIHRDRPACEISVTIQLGRSHHYSWPIFVDGKRYDLSEGDGVLYFGCDQEHWRNVCEGPPDYYSGQLFLHFVKQNGDNMEHAYDQKLKTDRKNIYERNRTILMMEK